MKDPGPANQPLIEIHDLDVEYYQQGAWVPVVENLHLHVNRAETFGLVGESGCGKSTTANVMLGFRPRGARYRSGSCWFEGRDLLALPNAALEEVRGNKIALVPQNPTTALSPGMCVGDQIAETLLTHKRSSSRHHAHDRAVELLGLVSLTEPEKAYTRYPHQLSGGQQQRAVIAMALACVPQLVILDEPTTGLDVTTQAQILDLLVDLRGKYGLAMFYVTHNLGVVAQICHRIGVMYAGRLVEVSPNRTLFHNPVHPYTQGLISSVPRIGNPSRHQSVLLKGLLRRSELPPGCNFAPRCEFATPDCFTQAPDLEMVDADHAVACWRWREIPPLRIRQTDCGPDEDIALDRERFASKPPLLEIEGLTAGYAVRRSALSLRRTRKVIAEDISLDIRPGETFALVGESGSGKTTVARAVVGLLPFVSGTVIFRDCNDRRNDLTVALVKRGDDVVRCVQLVFQNPDASLNPRQRIGQIIGRPLEVLAHMSGQALRDRVKSLMADVRLDSKYYGCYPDELSGGERQRVAIARALAAEPQLLLCDEILSALDVSVQANIIELLVDLQTRRGIAYLFISHDLAVVRSLAHRVGVLYWGAMCEVGNVEEVFCPPYHPYTYLLLNAVPEADPDQVIPPVRRDVGLVDRRETGRLSVCPPLSDQGGRRVREDRPTVAASQPDPSPSLPCAAGGASQARPVDRPLQQVLTEPRQAVGPHRRGGDDSTLVERPSDITLMSQPDNPGGQPPAWSHKGEGT